MGPINPLGTATYFVNFYSKSTSLVSADYAFIIVDFLKESDLEYPKNMPNADHDNFDVIEYILKIE